MQHRLCSLILILTLTLALGATLAAATGPQWAVTAAVNKVLLVKYEGGAVTSYQAGQLSESTLTGIGTYQGYVFVAGTITSGQTTSAVLHVGYIANPLANPTIQWMGTSTEHPQGVPISLGSSLKQPGAIAVDAAGGVYVLGSRWLDGTNAPHSNYAYVTSTTGWSSANVLIGNLAGTMATEDIAAYGSQAVIAHRNIVAGEYADMTWATGLNSGSTGASRSLSDDGYAPKGVAVGSKGFTYIANFSTEVVPGDGPSDPGVGSISIIDTSSLGSVGSAFQLGDFRPTDISYLTSGGVDYLGLIGVTASGTNMAVRLRIGSDGRPTTMEDAATVTLDSSANRSSASANGSLFWITQADKITVLDTASWAVHSASAVAPGYVTWFVPEPSSIIAMLTGVVGILGLRRRRKG